MVYTPKYKNFCFYDKQYCPLVDMLFAVHRTAHCGSYSGTWRFVERRMAVRTTAGGGSYNRRYAIKHRLQKNNLRNKNVLRRLSDDSLFYRYLVDTFLMASAFELGGEELIHDALCHGVVDETAGHYEHIGIVVLTDEMCNLGYPAQTGTDGLVLVESHVDALAAATDCYAWEYLALLDATG